MKSTSHHRFRFLRRAAWSLCGFAFLGACEPAAPPAKPLIRPVRHVVVALGEDGRLATFSGVTRAELETDLSFKVGGTVTELNADIGETVTEKQQVAALESTDYAVSLQEAEAGLARATAEARNADASYQRVRGLYESRNASRGDLDSARAQAESAEAQVRAARQQLTAARLQLSYTHLTAPRACTVARRYVDLNQNVSAGQPVLRLNCGECPEVVVTVSENYISHVRRGMDVDVIISAIDNQPRRGVVAEIAVATGQVGSAYPVVVNLLDNCADFRSGMAADVRMNLHFEGGADRIVVPFVAVGEDRDGNFVFVLEAGADGLYTARRRQVSIGDPAPGGIPVVTGLVAGERIATAGVRRLTEGQTVRLLPDEPGA